MEEKSLYLLTEKEWHIKVMEFIGDEFIIIPSFIVNNEDIIQEFTSQNLRYFPIYAKYEEYIINYFTGAMPLHHPDSEPVGTIYHTMYVVSTMKENDKWIDIDVLFKYGVELCKKYNLPYLTVSNGNRDTQLIKLNKNYGIKDLNNPLNSWELLHQSVRNEFFDENDVMSYFEGFYGDKALIHL